MGNGLVLVLQTLIGTAAGVVVGGYVEERRSARLEALQRRTAALAAADACDDLRRDLAEFLGGRGADEVPGFPEQCQRAYERYVMGEDPRLASMKQLIVDCADATTQQRLARFYEGVRDSLNSLRRSYPETPAGTSAVLRGRAELYAKVHSDLLSAAECLRRYETSTSRRARWRRCLKREPGVDSRHDHAVFEMPHD